MAQQNLFSFEEQPVPTLKEQPCTSLTSKVAYGEQPSLSRKPPAPSLSPSSLEEDQLGITRKPLGVSLHSSSNFHWAVDGGNDSTKTIVAVRPIKEPILDFELTTYLVPTGKNNARWKRDKGKGWGPDKLVWRIKHRVSH